MENIQQFAQIVVQRFMESSQAMQVTWVALCLLTGYVLFRFSVYFFDNARQWQYLRELPSPPGYVPYLGHALKLAGARPWDTMRQWSSKYGSVLVFGMPGTNVVYTNEPGFLKRILQTNQRNYIKDQDMAYKHFLCLLGKGLVTSEGEKWRKGRMLLSHALRVDILDVVPGIAIPVIQKLLKKLSTGKETDLNEEYRRLTLQVISQAALSLPTEEADKIFPMLYLPIVHECNKRVWAPWRQYMPWLEGCREQSRCLVELDTVLCDAIRKRWKMLQEEKVKPTGRQHDIADRYMIQLDSCDETTVLQLRDDVKTMLLAGHETSASILTWTTVELLRNPQFIVEVKKEAEEVFGECIRTNTLPTVEHVKRLRWIPACLREAARLHGIIPLVIRRAVQDDVIPKEESGMDHEITIPRGCAVAVGIDGLHHREDLWPQHNEFKPERFLPGQLEKVDGYHFIPFINGPRNCMGQHLAMVETQIVIGYIFWHCDLDLCVTSAAVAEHHDYILPAIPKVGLPVRATVKSSK